MTAPMWVPWLLLAAAFAVVVAEVFSTVRASRRPVCAADGCCGCSAVECDVLVAAGGRDEAYCWQCIDSWPVDGTPLAELRVTVLAGRERSIR